MFSDSLKVQVELDDFAAGTSSRSTKLIHGGIRYLALAFQSKIPPQSIWDLIRHLHYDHSMMQVVWNDLFERAYMIQSAPFMTQPLPMMIPLHKWWEIPLYWVSGKMYDWIAGVHPCSTSKRRPQYASMRTPLSACLCLNALLIPSIPLLVQHLSQ